MDELLNQTIKKIQINDDDTVLVFTTTSGEKFAYLAYADCCSESWFSNISGVDSLLDQEVLDIEEKEELYDLAGTRQESDNLYGFNLKTTQGVCEIEFRNSSNGYYGGSCELIGSIPTDLRVVKEDF